MFRNWYFNIISLSYLLENLGIKYSKCFLWMSDINNNILDVKPKIPIEIKIANKEDFINLLCANNKHIKKPNYEDLCFISVFEDKIIGYVWISLKNKIYVQEIEQNIILNNKESYLYRARVFPLYRKKRIMSSLIMNAMQYLKSKNIEKCYSVSFTINKAMNKVFISNGFHPIKIMKFIKIFKYRKYNEQAIK